MKHLLYKHIKSSLWLDSLENKQISNKTLPRQTHLEEKKIGLLKINKKTIKGNLRKGELVESKRKTLQC